jgi:hypothetical protein
MTNLRGAIRPYYRGLLPVRQSASKRVFKRYGRTRMVIKPELKAIDFTSISIDPSFDANGLFLVNPIQAGTSPGQMVGRSAIIKRISLNYTIESPAVVLAALSGVPLGVRAVLIYDRDPNSTVSLISDVFNTNGVNGFPNLNNEDRYTILYDKVHTIGCQQLVTGSATYSYSTGDGYAHGKCSKATHLPFVGPSTSGAVAGITTGAIYLWFVTDAQSFLNGISVRAFTRVRYIDK